MLWLCLFADIHFFVDDEKDDLEEGSHEDAEADVESKEEVKKLSWNLASEFIAHSLTLRRAIVVSRAQRLS